MFRGQVSEETEMGRASGRTDVCSAARAWDQLAWDERVLARIDGWMDGRTSMCGAPTPHATHAGVRVLHTGLPDYRINISDDIARAHL